MIQRRLGSSDLIVSAIGLGCWQFSGGSGFGGNFWPALPDSDVRDILRRCLEGGVNWFDTAEAYGWGASERALSASLKALGVRKEQIVVATKWWPVLRTASAISPGVEKQLRILDPFAIDLYQIHQPFGWSSVEKEMDAMARLAEAGKIRHVGVSNFSAKQLQRADAQLRRHGLRLVSNQVRFNLLHRVIESNGVLSAAKDLGISIIAYSPLAQGVLSGKYHDRRNAHHPSGYRRFLPDFSRRVLERTRPLIDVLRGVGSRHGATPSQVALRWVLSIHGEMIVAIPGATSPAQARDDAASAAVDLSEEDLSDIGEASGKCLSS